MVNDMMGPLGRAWIVVAALGLLSGCGGEQSSGGPLDVAPLQDAVTPDNRDAVDDLGVEPDSRFGGDKTSDTPGVDPLAACGTSGLVALEGAGVVSVCSDGILSGHTVVIDGTKICAVAPTESLALPADTVRLDLSGNYLIPGLTDMHVHFNRAEDATLYLVNGVTTIRNMWGQPWHLDYRASEMAGETLGPRLWTTGPLMDGEPPYWQGSEVVTDPQAATQSVLDQVKAGYDFIKVYGRLNAEVFEAIMAAAAQAGIGVVGHPPEAMAMQDVLTSGIASIEHLLGYDLETEVGNLETLTVEKGVWNCPTLVVYDHYARIEEFQQSPPDFLRYVHPSMVDYWMQTAPHMFSSIQAFQDKVMQLEGLGALLMAGTDTSNPFVAPGFSLHEELQLLVAAGLTPAKALRQATMTPAQFLGLAQSSGCIQPGMDADLVVLRANPLDEIKATTAIEAVMHRGKLHDRAELDGLLAATETGYAQLYGLEFPCSLPPDYFDEPAGDHVVFKAAGPLTDFDDPGGYASRQIDLVLDGGAVEVDSFNAFLTLDWSILGEYLTLHAFSAYSETDAGHLSYYYFTVSLEKNKAIQAFEGGNPKVEATGKSTSLAALYFMELKGEGAANLVKMCPVAVTAPDGGSSTVFCADAPLDLAKGRPVRLGGNHRLTTEPGLVLDALNMSNPCICFDASQKVVDCAGF